MVSGVPLDVSVEKLRGFISDHHANVIELKETRVVLAVTCGTPARPFLTQSNRATRFTMDVEFQEERTGRMPKRSQAAVNFRGPSSK